MKTNTDAKESIQVNVVLSGESLQDFIRYQERISPAQLSRAATIRLMMRDASANGKFGLTSKPIPGTAKRKRK